MACHAKGKGPVWLDMERVLRSFELAEDGRGRRAYVAWLEARAADDRGNIGQAAQDALRRGWYLGEETFRDRLLALVDKAKRIKPRRRRAAGGPAKDHGEMDAERLVREAGPRLGLPDGIAELAGLRKGDPRKAVLAALLRRRTAIGYDWIAARLQMGHPGSASRQVGRVRTDRKLKKQADELEKMYNSGA